MTAITELKFSVAALVVVAIASVILIMNLSLVQAQSSTLSNYENKYQGIKLEYPSYWAIDKNYTEDSDCTDWNICSVIFHLPNNSSVDIRSGSEKANDCFVFNCPTIIFDPGIIILGKMFLNTI